MHCTILSITFRDQIAEQTQRLLEQNSFAVVIASNFRELEELCVRGEFDVALVESEIQPKVKRAIGLLLRTNCPQAPVVEMCDGAPEIAGAEPVASDRFADLVPAIYKTLTRADLKSA